MSGPAEKVAQAFAPAAPVRKPDAKPAEPAKAPAEPGKAPAAPQQVAAAPVAAAPVARPPGPSRRLDRFAFDVDAPTASHVKEIDALAHEIAGEAKRGGGPIKVVITGHTDTSGKEAYNEGLGLRRAEKTKAALEAALRKAGLGPTAIDSIEVLSAGERNLLIETPDEKREPRNRAVEIATSLPVKSAPMATAPPEPEKKPLDLFKIPPSALPPLAERPPNPRFPDVPGPSREWVENYLRDDAVLQRAAQETARSARRSVEGSRRDHRQPDHRRVAASRRQEGRQGGGRLAAARAEGPQAEGARTIALRPRHAA